MMRNLDRKRNKPQVRCGLKILAVTILDWKALLYGGTVATVPPLKILAHGLNCVSACGESEGNARTQVNSGASWKRARVRSRNPSKRSGGLPRESVGKLRPLGRGGSQSTAFQATKERVSAEKTAATLKGGTLAEVP